jgi:hypothetical protein
VKRLVFGCLLAAGLVAPAFAQGTPPAQTRVRGTVASLAGNVLTVNGVAGSSTKVMLAPDFKVTYIVKSSLDKVVAGSYIGTAAEPQADGTLRAIEVQVFPPGFKPGPGSRPWDLTPTSTMTNGTVDTIGAVKVDKADAHVYTVTYEGGEKKVVVTPNTTVITYLPADATALTPGSHVIVLAVKKDDGSLSAANVSVGKDGLVPPM